MIGMLVIGLLVIGAFVVAIFGVLALMYGIQGRAQDEYGVPGTSPLWWTVMARAVGVIALALALGWVVTNR